MAMIRVPSAAAPAGTTAGAPLPARGQHVALRALSRLVTAVRSNRKATWGFGLLVFFCLVAAFPGVIAHDNPSAIAYQPRLGPSTAHWLGTTGLGQDMFAQIVYGTRPVLLIAFGVGLLGTLVAMLFGIAAAYQGGVWDGVLNLITDVLLVIPLFPLLIVIEGYLRTSSTVVMIAVLTFTGWSYTARQLRSQALTLRARDFLQAAKVRGERALYIVFVEIIPTMTSLLVASFLGNALYAVLFSVSLQFLGLGDPNQVSWGTMLFFAEQAEAFQTGQALWIIAPGLCIVGLGAAFALLNYAFDEIGNPQLRPLRLTRARKMRRASARPLRLRRASVEPSS
jgi:peptide/nickel transport system permease protein